MSISWIFVIIFALAGIFVLGPLAILFVYSVVNVWLGICAETFKMWDRFRGRA